MTSVYLLFSLSVVIGICSILTFFYVRSIIKTPAMIFTAQIYYEWISKQWSIIYLELNHEFMNEMDTVSSYIGASWRFAFYNLLIFWAASIVCRFLVRVFDPVSLAARTEKMDDTWAPANNDLVAISTLILLAIFGLEYLNFALSSALPLPGSVATRHNYWDQYARFGWLPILFGKLLLFVPLASGIVIYNKPSLLNKNIYYGFLLLYTGFLVISGQRFHGFLPGANLAFGVYIVHRLLRGRAIISKWMITAAIAIIAVLMVYATIEMGQRKLASLRGGAEQALVYRILVIQGGAYWNADSYVSTHGASYRYYDMLDGMRTILATIGTKNTFESYTLMGVNLAAGLPTITVLVCGYWLSVFIMIGYGALLGLTAFFVYWAARTGSVLLAFPISYLWMWTGSVYAHASLESIISPKFLAFVIVTVSAFLYTEFRRRDPRQFASISRR